MSQRLLLKQMGSCCRRLRFSLCSLILLVLVCSLPLSWIAKQNRDARQERRAAARLAELGAVIYYDTRMRQPKQGASSWLSRSLRQRGRQVFGDEFFDRVVGVELRNCNFAADDLAPLHALERLQWLDISSSNVTDDCLVHLRNLEQLSYVNLACTEITDAGVKELAQSDHIRSLVLAGSQITDRGIRHLRLSHHLEYVDLSRTETSSEARTELQQDLPNCHVVYLSVIKRLPRSGHAETAGLPGRPLPVVKTEPRTR